MTGVAYAILVEYLLKVLEPKDPRSWATSVCSGNETKLCYYDERCTTSSSGGAAAPTGEDSPPGPPHARAGRAGQAGRRCCIIVLGGAGTH